MHSGTAVVQPSPGESSGDIERVKMQYFDAVRDWVLRGSGSVHAMNATRASEKLKLPDAKIAEHGST